MVAETQTKGNGGMSRQAQEAKIITSQVFERIAFKIEAGEPYSQWIKITPGMAQEILAKYNKHNRDFRRSRMKLYARQMAADEWRKVSNPFIFNDRGELLDGQHRLAACVESGRAIDAFCVFGEPAENFAYVDLAAGRSAKDIFSIYGVKSAAHAASVTKFIRAYKEGISGRTNAIVFRFTNPQEAHDTYLALDASRVDKSVLVALKFGGRRMPYPTVMGGLHYLCSEKNAKMADEFFDGLVTGDVPSPRTNPIFQLRDRLLTYEKPVRMGAAGDVAQTWNAARNNTKVGQWYSRKGGKFPVIL